MRKLGVAAEPLRHRFERLEQTIDALGERLEPLLIVDGLQLDFDAKVSSYPLRWIRAAPSV